MEISEYRNHGRRTHHPALGAQGLRARDRISWTWRRTRSSSRAPLTALRARRSDTALTGEWAHCILRRCFVPERGSMTDKEPGRCMPDELSIHELAPADADAIFTAVTALQNDAAAPAPEEGAPEGDAFPHV